MSQEGRLALVFDDGYAEDYDQVLPVLRSAGVPAVFAVNPPWIGREGYLTRDQLDELAEAGCEVAAHGQRHRHLQAVRPSRPVGAGDRRVPVDAAVYPDGRRRVLVGDDYEVTDGTTREVREVAATGEGYVEFEAPLEANFDAGETVLRPTREVIARELDDVRAELRRWGFDPATFVFPYDAADVRAWAAARERYDVVADAAVRSLPNPRGTAPTNLRRFYFETDHLTRVEVADYLDAVADRDALGVLAAHSAWDTTPPERVESTVRAALDRGIEVTTLRAVADGR